MYKAIAGLMLVLLWAGCRKDSRERLFEMVYPNFTFEIPPGFAPTRALVFEFDDINTNFATYLQQSNTDPALIYAINPTYARITSLDDQSLFFVEQISVRFCTNNGEECSFADEVFYIDDLRGRADEVVDLLPSLRNVKTLMSGQDFRMEIVFFLNDFTPYSNFCRLDMTFEAVK